MKNQKQSRKINYSLVFLITMIFFLNDYSFAQKVGWPITEDEDAIFLSEADYNCHCYAWFKSENQTCPQEQLDDYVILTHLPQWINDDKYIPSYYLENETDKIAIFHRSVDPASGQYYNGISHSIIRSLDNNINRFPEWVQSTNGNFPLFRHRLDVWYQKNEYDEGNIEIEPFTNEEIEGFWSVHFIKPRINGDKEIFKYTACKLESVYITNAQYSWSSSSNVIIVSTDYNKVFVRGTRYGKGWIECTIDSHTNYNDIVIFRKNLDIVPEPAPHSLKVSPNPVPDNMEINIESNDENNNDLSNVVFEFGVYNIYNLPIIEDQFIGYDTNISTSNLQNGIYIVKVQNQEYQIFLSKVVVIQQ